MLWGRLTSSRSHTRPQSSSTRQKLVQLLGLQGHCGPLQGSSFAMQVNAGLTVVHAWLVAAAAAELASGQLA
jgi:hypothetical protein